MRSGLFFIVGWSFACGSCAVSASVVCRFVVCALCQRLMSQGLWIDFLLPFLRIHPGMYSRRTLVHAHSIDRHRQLLFSRQLQQHPHTQRDGLAVEIDCIGP